MEDGDEWKRQSPVLPMVLLHVKQLENLIQIDKRYAHNTMIEVYVPKEKLNG